MSDEEYVWSVWDGIENLPLQDYRGIGSDYWAAAAEFTRERMEQIRQLEADIEWARGMSNTPEEVLLMGKLNTSEVAVVWTKNLHASCRILVRLESALADLKRGMKDEREAVQ